MRIGKITILNRNNEEIPPIFTNENIEKEIHSHLDIMSFELQLKPDSKLDKVIEKFHKKPIPFNFTMKTKEVITMTYFAKLKRSNDYEKIWELTADPMGHYQCRVPLPPSPCLITKHIDI